jgi:hypothetical protein
MYVVESKGVGGSSALYTLNLLDRRARKNCLQPIIFIFLDKFGSCPSFRYLFASFMPESRTNEPYVFAYFRLLRHPADSLN